MTIHLTPEQERRLRAVLDRGAYKSVEEVVEAALTAVEQRTVPGFAGTPEELDTLLAEGLASKQLTDDEFWSSVSTQTDALLAEHKTPVREGSVSRDRQRRHRSSVPLLSPYCRSTRDPFASGTLSGAPFNP
jgi:Arc/MetJ-type ribon-helix-helix transcriptional regulator